MKRVLSALAMPRFTAQPRGMRRLATPVLLWCVCWGVVAFERPARGQSRNVDACVDRVDSLLRASWNAAQVVPASRSSDAEYFRRVSLDVTGRIPTVHDVRTFLADPAPDKRAERVEQLLQSTGYERHFARVWSTVLLPEADAVGNTRFFAIAFESWLRQQLADNTPYDVWVDELLTTPLGQNRGVSPEAFYQTREVQPENLAASTARIFLGLRIDCAQCHDHPFDDWTQKQFWEFAAFYAGVQRTRRQDGLLGSVQEFFTQRTLQIPETKTVVRAAYLNGERAGLRFGESARERLAEWITSGDNPYFARAVVNRFWEHFLGTGLIDPVDDFRSSNPPSQPEVLEELTRFLVASEFDLRALIRVITRTEAYQLTSRQTHPSQQTSGQFARMPLKGLTADQLFDSLARATGHHAPFDPRAELGYRGLSPRRQFQQAFRDVSDSPTDRHTSILQSLMLMNGNFIEKATDLQNTQTLRAVTEFPGLTPREQIETLFLATLSRLPTAGELETFERYLERGGPRESRPQALADIFWVLLNSGEFAVNH